MDIRDAGFWPDIERLFPHKSQEGWCLCSHPQLLDRLRTACRRAERYNNFVLLILMQLPRVEGQSSASINRLGTCLRACDSLCDLGANRLALLIDDMHDPAVAPLVIERLMSMLTDACVSATLFPINGVTDEKVWASTESALDKAVKTGIGTYSLLPMVTGRAAMERFELSKDLYAAHKNGEFKAVYQPIIDLADRRIHAVEVFMRWQHPRHGSLAPELFLPILEESGLIVPVGERMLADTCKFLAALRSEGREDFRACINISPRQLEDSGFLLSVLDALYDAELDPAWLQLEFQESIMASRAKLVRRILPELHNAGVQLALDHFGTGDAPLADLVRLPIDLIKLDHSLVENIVEDSVSQAITTGTLAFASAAGMQVAAVGVEQRLQNGMLERLGCREAQGRYYSYPLSESELCSMLAGVTH